jgi:GTPase
MALKKASAPTVAIVGRTNVGKSSLFNRLVGERQAITHDSSGTTRDSNYGLVTWGNSQFWLVDTAGLQKPGDELEQMVREQISQAADSADLIVVVVDSGVMVTAEDRQAAKLALKTGKPTILAVNKVDTTKSQVSAEFRRLGIDSVVGVSAIHGQGTGDLLEEIRSRIKKAPITNTPADAITLGLLGRPNVGKSSLLNALTRKQQAIVTPVAGTTRDVNTSEVMYHGRQVNILDTAGLRRRGKIEPGVEKFSTLRTLSAIAASDICVVVMDAAEPSVAGDQHIAGLVTEAGKGLILLVNKWDAIEKDDKTQALLGTRIKQDFQFAWWAPLIFTSATTGANITKLFELVAQIDERRRQEISTPNLNKSIEALVAKHPPAGMKGRQPKINYATQIGTEPPTFALFCSYPDLIHFSYRRYLENGLREAYDFIGTPIKLEFKDKRRKA